jgi:hypothetical protein
MAANKARKTPKGAYFSRVREAREALKAKAEEIVGLQIEIVKRGLETGKLDVAASANQWLLEHMPEEEGVKVIDVSIDKPRQVEGHAAPSISIGFAIGGMKPQAALPAPPKVEVSEPEVLDSEIVNAETTTDTPSD